MALDPRTAGILIFVALFLAGRKPGETDAMAARRGVASKAEREG